MDWTFLRRSLGPSSLATSVIGLNTPLFFFSGASLRTRFLCQPCLKTSMHYHSHKWGQQGNVVACMEWAGIQDRHLPYYKVQPTSAFMRYVHILNTPLYITIYYVTLLIIPIEWHEFLEWIMTHPYLKKNWISVDIDLSQERN
jgi:hypothetical protein